MRKNKIKEKWRAGKFTTLGWLSIAHSFTAELMARQGFDALCVDLQHGTGGEEKVVAHGERRRDGQMRASVQTESNWSEEMD